MKKITIFEKEKRDGLEESIASQNSLAYCAPAAVVPKEDWPESTPELEKILAGKSNPDQIDLYYLESVLVSTGWNKNDDVFSTQSTWEARSTPEDKQFNFMHNENDIIGHITGSYIIDGEGNKVSASDNEPPQKFDIITEAVLYNSWTNPENRERMQQIIAEIEEGKWFVSMECLFAGFDYALIDPEGNSKLLARDESSSFLTKHLRSYGGTGEYEGYKVGRALRDISFSGKGLVAKPANPRSIIFNSSKAFYVEKEEKITEFSIGDNKMADLTLLEKQVDDLKSDLAQAKEENAAIKAQIEEAKDKEFAATTEAFESDISSKDQTIAELEETIKSQKANLAELEDSLAQKSEELAEAMKTLDGWKQHERQQKRLASLVGAGFDSEEAEQSLALYEALDDEAFEGIVAKWNDKKKKDKDKDEEAKSEVEAEESEADKAEVTEAEETEEAEATEEMFDEVESAEATLVEAVDTEDELQQSRASVAEYIAEHILKTNN